MRQTLNLGMLAVVNLGITFIFQWYIITELGAGVESDAFFAGMTIPQLMLAVISGSLMHVLVPLLAGENKEQARRDVWCFFILVALLFGILSVVLGLTAGWWVPITVPGFSVEGQDLTILLTRIQLIGMLFSAINGVQWASHHARESFIWPELTPILSSTLCLFLLIYFLPIYGVIAAGWIATLRIALQTMLLFPGMGKPIWPDFSKGATRSAWVRIQPLLLGTIYFKTDPLIDRYLLSLSGSGNLSLYYFAQQIYSAGSQIINKSIASPLVPKLSKLFKNGKYGDFESEYRKKLLQVGIVSFGGFLCIGIGGHTILNLLIGHGEITLKNIDELWWIMIWLGGAFIGGTLGQISSSSFYAIGDTSTPTRLGICTYTVYVPAKFILFYYASGTAGLAIITSVFFITNFFLQSYKITKSIKSLEEV